MGWRSAALGTIGWMLACFAAQAAEVHNAHLQSQVEALFAEGSDIAETKLTIDNMITPSVDIGTGRSEIARLEADLDGLVSAKPNATAVEKLTILKQFVYQPGPWNNGNAFQYDLSDPLGLKPENRLLIDYLSDRRGNCVSMPILFMVLGQHIGLKMTLAAAPLHMFVKFTDDDGKEWNLETTSGAGFTRDAYYREKLPMSDASIASGIYLYGLSRDETIAAMGSDLVEHFLNSGRYEDAIVTADILLKHAPKSAHLLVKRGSAYAAILRRDIVSKYKTINEMTTEAKAYADGLYQANMADFKAAEQLGWREQDGQL